ncbi:MAG TPA: EAL domain-containing protein [Ilumatobacteraceae bacterium]|nr:EAL domain-containing protein [Ilumatobacteraceae bacterium]
MVNEDKLSDVLSEFARTVITDFPIQGILDHLVDRIVEVLPVTSAGVTLISPGTAPQYIAASDDSALRFEKLQSELGEGPCVAAYESGEAVAVPDVSADERFPVFAPAAVAAGLGAVFTFPLCRGNDRLGALDLYRDTPGALDSHDMAAAQTLADVAAAYLLNAYARDEARATTERFRYGALHDPLTGLANRSLLQERIVHLTNRSKRSHANTAILFVDLDRFKQVNDSHGHQVGDELLVAVARRLSGLVRMSDTLARFSGDEFVFLCEDMSSTADVVGLATRINEVLAEPFLLVGTKLVVSASVGIAFAGPGDDISDQLLVEADMAMYQAKRRGGAAHQVIDMREALRSNGEHTLEIDLRLALAHDELDVAYQPIVRSTDGLVTAVEALLRWIHPQRGAVPASWMVGVAERSELINEIGAWVLQRSCRDHGRWVESDSGSPIDLAVNISARQLVNPGFLSTVRAVLAQTNMDPTALILEVTENIYIEAGEPVMAVLAELRRLGIRIALDDFGCGYSSLNYLGRLPIDILKIDRSFIADIGVVPASTAIVEAVTNLAHVLNLTVVAEGVETQDQREAVCALGCDCSQGFFYGRPVTASAIAAQLDVSPAGPLHLPRPENSPPPARSRQAAVHA